MFINRYLLEFAKDSKLAISITCFLELLLTLLDTSIAISISIIINILLGGDLFFNIPIAYPFIGIFILIAVRFFIFSRKVIIANKSSINIKSVLRKNLLERVFQLGPAYIANNRSGDIANTISNKVEWLSSYYILYLPVAMASIINAMIIIIILSKFDYVLGIILTITTVAILGFPLLFYVFTKKRGEIEWKAHTDYYSDCLDSIQGIITLKSFNANDERKEYIKQQGENLRQKVMSQLRITMLETGLLEFLTRVGSALSVAIVVLRVSNGASSGGEFLIYVLFLAGACFSPMMNLGNAWHLGYRGITASYSIIDLLNQKPILESFQAKTEGSKKEADSDFREDIIFDNVNFSYSPEEPDVLKNVSFVVPRGTMTAIVGPSGSGKSTIAHLFSGFYPVKSGEIRFGNLKLDENNVSFIQSLIAAVWQDSHIFYGTVYENIKIGKEDATHEEIINASKKANLHDFIMQLPDKYDTLLGENGMRFSGGEKQRISLARAFLKNSPIIILDEATSSLDRKNEIEIQKSIKELMRGKTAIVIAHRLATIKQAQQICIIEGGIIKAHGTHQELSKTSSLYKKLMGDQFGNENE